MAFAAGIFCIQLDAFALSLVLPQIGLDLNVKPGELNWVNSAYLLSVGSLMLGAGRLSDRYGYHRILLSGEILFGLSSLLCALAPSIHYLIFFRMLQGCGGALIMPAGLALLSNIYPKGQSGRAIGLAIGIGGTASALGPFLGGLFAAWYSWRLLFWINVPIALLGAYAVSRSTLSSFKPSSNIQVDVLGLFIMTLSVGMISFLLHQTIIGTSGTYLNTIGLCILVTLIAIFVFRERNAAHAIIDLTLFRNMDYVALTLSGAVTNAVTVIFLFTVPLSLQSVWKLPPHEAGLIFLFPAIIMAFGGPIAGRVKTRHAAVVMGVCLLGAGLLFLSFAEVKNLPGYLVCLTFCAGLLGIANALTLVATQAVVDTSIAGLASGVTKTLITLAAGFGVVLISQSVDQAVGLVSGHFIQSTLTTTGMCSIAAFCLLACWGLKIHFLGKRDHY